MSRRASAIRLTALASLALLSVADVGAGPGPGVGDASAQGGAAAPWAELERRADADAADPALRDWAESRMHPAFLRVAGPALERCLDEPSLARPPEVELVLVVAADGRVAAVHWRQPSPFAACLDRAIGAAGYPSPPRAPFHFRMGFELPARR